MEQQKKLGLWTLILLIFVPTFGFGNITNNVVALGAASIPSWFIVTIFFFLPLSLFIAELAAGEKKGSAGIYTWINSSMGPNWAFIGTWSYFVSTLFYLQMVYARIPVMVSWTLFGRNIFGDSNAYLLPYISIGLVVFLTWVATRGVKTFSRISNFGGKFTLAATGIFIVFALLGFALGEPSQTRFTAENLMPTFDTEYFSTFAWLLLAVAGAEVGGTYLSQVENPKKNFPKGVLIATLLIGAAYTIGSIAVLLIASPEVIVEAGIKDSNYLVYKILAENWHLPGGVVVRIYAGIVTVTSIAAYIVWMESPLRALFSEVPEGTFPRALTKQEEDGTLKSALWVQCAVLVVLMAVPLLGIGPIDAFFNMLTDLSSLSSVPAYVILAVAYLVFRLQKQEAEFTAFKTNRAAVPVAVVVIGLGVLGFIGAGLDYLWGMESFAESLQWIIKIYGGPVIMVLLGFGLRALSRRSYQKNR